MVSFFFFFFIKLADVKHESLEAYLVKFKENLSFGFKTMAIFSKGMFLKIEYILQRFYFD